MGDYNSSITIVWIHFRLFLNKIHFISEECSLTMRSRDDILKQLKLHMNILTQKFYVQRIGVFGSVSRGDPVEGSDIDILVEFSRPVGFFLFLELEEYLTSLLGAKVDLVTPDALKPATIAKISSEVAYA